MTLPFRDITPLRRARRRECKHYTSYKKTLREDFLYRCGYCNDSDKRKFRSFAIDHFVPKNPRDFIHAIKPNYYYNLVWSCSYCNLAKSDKWPTKNASVHNDGSTGFVDPVSDEYNDLFFRDENGCIIPNDDHEIASYIKEELKLWLPIHSLNWKLEKLKTIELSLKKEMKENHCATAQQEINEIGACISSILDDIFKENE